MFRVEIKLQIIGQDDISFCNISYFLLVLIHEKINLWI